MGCGTAIMRLILFVVNFLITLLALVMTVVGVFAAVHYSEMREVFGQAAMFITFGTLCLGLMLLIVGVTGVCGACVQGTAACLIMHSIFLVILIVAEGVGAGFLFYYTGTAEQLEERLKLDETVGDVFFAYGGNETSVTAITDAVDLFQQGLSCCGQYGYKDWANASISFTWAETLNNKVYLPDSCCKTETADCGEDVDLSQNETMVAQKFYTQGCQSKIRDFMNEWTNAIAGVMMSAFVLQLICLLFSCCLCCIKDHD